MRITLQGLATYLRRLQCLSDFSWAVVSTTAAANVFAALIPFAQEQRDTVSRGVGMAGVWAYSVAQHQQAVDFRPSSNFRRLCACALVLVATSTCVRHVHAPTKGSVVRRLSVCVGPRLAVLALSLWLCAGRAACLVCGTHSEHKRAQPPSPPPLARGVVARADRRGVVGCGAIGRTRLPGHIGRGD